MLTTLLLTFFVTETNTKGPPLDVSVDWSNVPDSVVAECKLLGLENVLLQYLLDRDYAVVRTISSRGVKATISADAHEFALRAVRGAIEGERRISRPQPCDATIELDLAHALVDLLAELE